MKNPPRQVLPLIPRKPLVIHRACWALVTCYLALILLTYPVLSSSAALAASGDPVRAAKAWGRAVTMRTALESRPEHARSLADYENLLSAFRAVYRFDPAYRKVPAALATVGALYEEMAREFSSAHCYTESIKAYQFLISEYPQSRVSRDALFTIGEIYRSELDNPEEARKIFEEFLEQYPSSSKADSARQELAKIERLLSERASSRLAGNVGPTEWIPQVNRIHRWVGSDYTRIVIGVEDEVKFNTSRLTNPDRLVFDLLNTRLSPALAGKTFAVEDGFLREIRVGQYKPSVTRVVLDVKKIEDYFVFSLPNPFRLVIDIHGQPAGLQTFSPKASPAGASTRGATTETMPGRRAEPRSESQTASQSPSQVPAPEAKHQRSLGEEEVQERASLKPPELPPTPPSGTGPEGTLGAGSRQTQSPIRPAAPTETGSRTLTRALGLKIGKIAIDPGHGGHDTGTIGPNGLREKDLVLDVALRLKRLIWRKMASEVVMTRGEDTFVPLEERTAIANQSAADLFISLHANASRDPSARGVETYYLNFTSNPEALEVAARENATSQESVHKLQKLIERIALTEKIQESREFARQVQRAVYAQTGQAGGEQRDRGLKKAPFVVLIGANMPSILAEISFLTNPHDERLLKRATYRQKIAEALYKGIAVYVNNLGGLKVAAVRPSAGASSGGLAPARPARQGAARHSSPPASEGPATDPDF